MTDQQNLISQLRQKCARAKRIVVKVGTHVLVNKRGHPNTRRIQGLVQQLSQLGKKNCEIVLVSSGAIGAGMATLKLIQRPRDLSKLQMAASVGQMQLLRLYQDYFSKEHCIISQVLLTHADLKHRGRHLNARNTMNQLLKHRIIPIVNENDVVAVDEIQIGDNDVLSALVATLIDADLLILLTQPDGLRKPAGNKTMRVRYLETITPHALSLVFGKNDPLSTGGMKSKLEAAHIAIKAGIPVVIASGKKPNVIDEITQGKDVGTLLGSPDATLNLRQRQHWISFFHRTEGEVYVDAGAARALRKQGKSLLPVGITKIQGRFSIGALLKIIDNNNEIVGTGLSEYSSEDIERIKGKTSAWVRTSLSPKHPVVVIHRDNMIIEK